jgi:hypothetical protein
VDQRDSFTRSYIIRNRPNVNIPACIFCSFPSYTGPTVEESCVSIITQNQQIFLKETGAFHTVKSFPFRLSFALTVHKCHSKILSRGIVKILEREFFLQLTFTAISRCKSLNTILFRNNMLTLGHFKSRSFMAGLWQDTTFNYKCLD